MAAGELYIPSPIIDQRVTPLDWSDGNFNYPDMSHIHIIRDGSCFFHAVANAINIPYKTGFKEGRPFNRREFIRDFRYDLAAKLSQKVDPTDPESDIYYDTLSRGQLRNVSSAEGELARYSLKNMQEELRSSSAVDFIYNEFVSNLVNIDIYILDFQTKDVYVFAGTSDGNDLSLYYKQRNSIVLLYIPGHYDLVGLNNEGQISTLFTYDHPFIVAIRKRINKVIATGAT